MKWDPELLYQKAKLYLDRANDFEHESHEFPFWSSLAMELLARAALTKLHPALNADPTHQESLLYACGVETTQQPKSLPLHAVLLRLEKIVPGFGSTQRELCDFLALLRNDEIHSGELPYERLPESKWLPRFYEVCRVLSAFVGKDLDDLLGPQLSKAADRLIDALLREAAKSVKGRIVKHAKEFAAKPETERRRLVAGADTKSRLLPPGLSSVACPACDSPALVSGDLIKELRPKYEGDNLVVDLEYLATGLRCPACDLQLHNVEEILHAGLEPRFLGQRATELHEFFEPDFYEEYMNM